MSQRKSDGQDLPENALLTALIALIAIGLAGAAGESVAGIFRTIASAFSGR